jgi:Tfp pilus assembly protein PilF
MHSTRGRRRSIGLVIISILALAACRRNPEQEYATLIDSGTKLLEKRDYVQAILRFRGAVQLAPGNAEPLYRLGLAYLASGNITEGVTALVKATAVDPKHAGSQLKLAELLAGSKDKTMLEESQKRLREVLSVRPADSDALTALALTESRLGNQQKAEEHLREALGNSPSSLKAAVVMARIKLAQRDIPAAEGALRSAIQESPKSPDARLAMAELLLTLNRPQEAETELKSALELDRKNVRAMLGLAALASAARKDEEAGRIYREVSGLGDPRYRHLYGAYLFNSGRRDAAVQEFERLAREDPADRDARTRLVAAYLAANRGTDASRVLDAALQKNPRDVDALLLKSEMLVEAGKPAEAQKNLTEVLRFKPEASSAHLLMAKIYGARGSVQLQRQELSQALQYRPEYLEARLELAKLHIDTNAPRLALDLLDQAPPSQRQGTGFRVVRNQTLLATGDMDEFSKGVAEGLAIARIPDLLVQDAQARLARKDYAGARRSLQEALRKNPSHLGALQVTLQVAAANKGLATGLEELREYAAGHPELARVQLFVGERMLAAGRGGEARALFTAAGGADRNFADADLALAQLDYLEGNYAAARQRLAGLAPAAAERPAAQLLSAAVEHKAGNRRAAEQLYRKVLEADPHQTVALNNLASLLAESGTKQDEALKYAQEARELAPGNADVSGTLGWLYYKRGVYATALEHLREAVALDASATGRNPASRKYYLGMTYLKLGDRERGTQMLEQALRLSPDMPEAGEARAAIRGAGGLSRQ